MGESGRENWWRGACVCGPCSGPPHLLVDGLGAAGAGGVAGVAPADQCRDPGLAGLPAAARHGATAPRRRRHTRVCSHPPTHTPATPRREMSCTHRRLLRIASTPSLHPHLRLLVWPPRWRRGSCGSASCPWPRPPRGWPSEAPSTRSRRPCSRSPSSSAHKRIDQQAVIITATTSSVGGRPSLTLPHLRQ